jgi:type II secretory pathway pseudopilin PulG
MVAFLVAIALLSLGLSMAMPAWRTANQREKEAELLWRGQQYDRALKLFQRKFAAPGPPSIDILVEQRFLRKKYKDPITNDEFELVPVGPVQAGNLPPGVQPPQRAQGQLIGGVRSKSEEQSLKEVNGRNHYNEWQFVYMPYGGGRTPQPGQPNQPGARPGQPGQPGQPGTGPAGPGTMGGSGGRATTPPGSVPSPPMPR